MRRLIAVALLTFALAQLGVRGMQRVRHEVPLWDFASVYAASRAWVHGADPYDTPAVMQTWRSGNAFADRDISYFATVYPPTSLLLLVPFALSSAKVALVAWLMITLALLVAQFIALVDMAKLPWRDARTLILLAASLASAPLQFGLLSGQLSLPAISLCIVAFWTVSRNRETLGGVLLALACALKPQIGAPFFLYYLLMRRRTISSAAIVVGVLIGGFALLAMYLSHVDWIAGWTNSVSATTTVGGVNDYTWSGPWRDEIIDLKVLLISVPFNAFLLRIVILGTFVGLLAWYVRSLVRDSQRAEPRHELLALAALSALAMIPVYHRVYDATLLTAALAWALAELDGERRRYAVAMIVPMCLLLIPFDLANTLGRHAPRLLAVSQTWWWQSFLAPHYSLALIALTVVMLKTMSDIAVVSERPELARDAADDAEDIMLAH